jgi:hypothetical protein
LLVQVFGCLLTLATNQQKNSNTNHSERFLNKFIQGKSDEFRGNNISFDVPVNPNWFDILTELVNENNSIANIKANSNIVQYQ